MKNVHSTWNLLIKSLDTWKNPTEYGNQKLSCINKYVLLENLKNSDMFCISVGAKEIVYICENGNQILHNLKLLLWIFHASINSK